MRVIYHNWSAMKQRPHPQSVAEIRGLGKNGPGKNGPGKNGPEKTVRGVIGLVVESVKTVRSFR